MRGLVFVAAALLLGLGGIKVFSLATAGGQMTEVVDPVFGAPLYMLALLAAAVEIGIGLWTIAQATRPKRAAVGFLFLGHSWLIYQGIRGVLPEPGRCPCLGQLPIWFPWLGAYETPILLSIALWYVLVGWGLVIAESNRLDS